MSREKKPRKKAEGPLSQDHLNKWFLSNFRKGTIVQGIKTGTTGSCAGTRCSITWLVISEPSLSVVDDKVRILFTVSAFKNDNPFAGGSGIKSMIIDITAYKIYKDILTFIHVDDTAESANMIETTEKKP